MKPLSSTGPLWTVREAGDLMLIVQHSSMLMVETEDWIFSPGGLGVSRWFSSPPLSTSSWLGVLILRERWGKEGGKFSREIKPSTTSVWSGKFPTFLLP